MGLISLPLSSSLLPNHLLMNHEKVIARAVLTTERADY